MNICELRRLTIFPTLLSRRWPGKVWNTAFCLGLVFGQTSKRPTSFPPALLTLALVARYPRFVRSFSTPTNGPGSNGIWKRNLRDLKRNISERFWTAKNTTNFANGGFGGDCLHWCG